MVDETSDPMLTAPECASLFGVSSYDFLALDRRWARAETDQAVQVVALAEI
ncbi:hypothetical protein [Bradyrhizobium zhanjiangense]|uniref:hypothetical protein n=1 Tax=Bradyrhizobium zhanjiangense TaxID=1325107 RepID=UPI001FE136E4|nr:hypothetical protein [Bradyrhizobium zhanjiangense]